MMEYHEKFGANIKQLTPKSPLFLSLFGSNTMKSIEQILEKNKLVSIFPIEGLKNGGRKKQKYNFLASNG